MAPTPSRTPKETAAKKGIEVRLNDRNARADDALAPLAAFSLAKLCQSFGRALRLVPCLSGLRLLQSPPTLEVPDCATALRACYRDVSLLERLSAKGIPDAYRGQSAKAFLGLKTRRSASTN
jgi:hypothetical protein